MMNREDIGTEYSSGGRMVTHEYRTCDPNMNTFDRLANDYDALPNMFPLPRRVDEWQSSSGKYSLLFE